jgi:hypothetical protein
MIAPARDTTADVMMPSPRSGESFLRSDHRQNTPIAATMAAIITGINSRRSSVGILLFLHRFQGHLFAGIGFEIVNGLARLRGFEAGSRDVQRNAR